MDSNIRQLIIANTLWGAHTQGVETAWKEENILLKRVRRSTAYLQSYLDESVRWALNRTHPGGLLNAFLQDAKCWVSSNLK